MVNKLSKSAQLQRFCSVTNATTDEAQTYLKVHNNRLEAAIDAYLTDQTNLAHLPRLTAQQEKAVRAQLNALFDKYKDDDEPDLMASEGALAMLQDLGIDPASVAVLPLSYYLNAPTLGQFTRSDYTEGWLRLGVGATTQGPLTHDILLAQQKEAVARMMETFAQDGPVLPLYKTPSPPSKKGLYTTVYEYTFAFARGEGQKNLGLDMALAFWDLLMPYAPSYGANGSRASAGPPSFSPAQFEMWKRFLTEASQLRVISKDTWSQFLEFTREIDPAFSNHDFEAAWPSVIDEFVGWAQEQKKM
ncbi:Scaffold-type E3 ligase [Malassezia pachydermatis]